MSMGSGMARHSLLCALCAVCVEVVLAAAPPVRTVYTDALAREQSVRTVLSAPDATAEILADVHAVIARYELLVRRYPGSGYSANALWQGGRLALDAFARFRQPADRDAGVRLLRRLAAMFPTSKLAAPGPAELP